MRERQQRKDTAAKVGLWLPPEVTCKSIDGEKLRDR